MAAKIKTSLRTTDQFLATLDATTRTALEKLRKSIAAAAPDAEECISYGLPAFRLDGKPLVAFGSSAKHCAFYPMSERTIADHASELSEFETSKGTVRFQPERALPVALVRKLVKARIAEIRGAPTNTVGGELAPKRRRAKTAATKTASEGSAAVETFLKGLDPTRRAALDILRETIKSVRPTIGEEIKWNAPSFRTLDHFATVNLRNSGGAERVWLILHAGAKKKNVALRGAIDAPDGWLEWLAADRAVVKFADAADVRAKSAVLRRVVRQWLARIEA